MEFVLEERRLVSVRGTVPSSSLFKISVFVFVMRRGLNSVLLLNMDESILLRTGARL